MPARLTPYKDNATAKTPDPKKPTPSGVACPQRERKPKCKGQMMYREPREAHPQYPELHRASCSFGHKCGELGWV